MQSTDLSECGLAPGGRQLVGKAANFVGCDGPDIHPAPFCIITYPQTVLYLQYSELYADTGVECKLIGYRIRNIIRYNS